MPNNNIPRKVFSMEDLENKKIVQHNDLIKGVARMGTVPLKFFELAVACLDIENIPSDRTVYVSKELLFSFFKAKSQNKHSNFKDALVQVQLQPVFIVNVLDEVGVSNDCEEGETKYEYNVVSPIEKTTWNDYGDEVSFKFTESIMPYLIELKSNFTQYLLSDISNLSSKHAITIYKWISMNYNQYEYYQSKGSRNKKQLEMMVNPIISVKDLRKITDTENTYTAMRDFTKRILDDTTTMISENTIFDVEYQKIKKGAKIVAIKFFVTKQDIIQNEFYKEEQQDPAFLAQKEKEEEEAERLYQIAVNSNYKNLLSEFELINDEDIQDKEIMAGLQKNVFPLYDQLEQQKGAGSVEKHVSYVASRMESYSKRNIVRYLQVSIDNYLSSFNNNPYK